jgi:long-chain fatty acid transport protein
MKKVLLSLAMALSMAVFSAPAFATNGDNIIGVGTISRSMGGVGAAAPQDAITAVFGNPAAMCYIPCETSEADFAGTVFDPSIRATVSVAGEGGTLVTSATSKGAPYAFPAIGIYTPISDKWRFGLAAYGVSGLGVDYKDTALATAFGAPGLGTDIFTQFQLMKFAPNIAYMIMPNLSVGAALQVNYAQLDLGDGSSHNFGVGTQLGVNYKPLDGLSLGLTYQTPQRHTFKRVANLDGALNPGVDFNRERLALEQPQQVVLGVAYEVIPKKLLVEVNEKWLNWKDTDGYGDFGWRDQYVTAVGVQFKPMDWMAIRAGYNYGRNPVKTHDGFNPLGLTNVQGANVPTTQFEYLRVIGFPAVVEHHLTVGAGLNLSKKVSLNIGYMHAFENTIKETSAGNIFTFESKLFEDSYEFGINFMF